MLTNYTVKIITAILLVIAVYDYASAVPNGVKPAQLTLRLLERNRLPMTPEPTLSISDGVTDFRMTEVMNGVEYHVDNRGLITKTNASGTDLGVFLDVQSDDYFVPRIRIFAMRIDPLDATRAYVLASTTIDNPKDTVLFQSAEDDSLIDSHMILLEYAIDTNGIAIITSKREVVRFEQRLNVTHVGGGMVFSADGLTLFFAIGDHQRAIGTGVPGSQDPEIIDGVIVALNPRLSGSQPFTVSHQTYGIDNPVFAIGLRNPQSMERIGETIYFSNIGKNAAETMHVLCQGCNYGWGAFIEGIYGINEIGQVVQTFSLQELTEQGFEAPFAQIDRRNSGLYGISNIVCNTTTLPDVCVTADLVSGELYAIPYQDIATDKIADVFLIDLIDPDGQPISRFNQLPSNRNRVDPRPEQAANGELIIVLEGTGQIFNVMPPANLILQDTFDNKLTN